MVLLEHRPNPAICPRRPGRSPGLGRRDAKSVPSGTVVGNQYVERAGPTAVRETVRYSDGFAARTRPLSDRAALDGAALPPKRNGPHPRVRPAVRTVVRRAQTNGRAHV